MRYCHLSLDDRRKIYILSGKKQNISEIAAQLGRHRSTVYREIRRNTHLHEEEVYRGYFPAVAQELARGRRRRLCKLEQDRDLRSHIVERLREYWSPEQIAGDLRRHCHGSYACPETIYQYIYSAEGHRSDLYRYLFQGRAKRRKRFGRKQRREQIPLQNSIHCRPETVGNRTAFGHWECDLLAFQREHGLGNVTSMIERKTRYTLLIRNRSKATDTVIGGIAEHLKTLPPPSRQSITFDRGYEFMSYPFLLQHGVQSYFCDPRSPWQKGSVENNNGRLRRFLPSNTNIAAVPDAELVALCVRMNNTPRKCLNYRTPQEAFREDLQQLPESLSYNHKMMHFG